MQRERLQRILTSLSISWRDATKCVNICCPFCVGKTSGGRDDKYRGGIFVDNLRFHCFRCKRAGTFYDVLYELLGFAPDEYKELVGGAMPTGETPSDAIRNRLGGTKMEKPTKRREVRLPTSFPITPEVVGRYGQLRGFLKRRKIEVLTCVEYGARYTGQVGEHACRIIVPIRDEDGRLVAWQGRDVSGLAKARYFSEGGIMEYLYWTDLWLEKPHRIYLVEGVFDCWRMDRNAVACFSHAITQAQRRKLMLTHRRLQGGAGFGIDELVVVFDSDSYEAAVALSRDLGPLLPKVGAVRLPEGMDPDSYGAEAVRALPVRWA